MQGAVLSQVGDTKLDLRDDVQWDNPRPRAPRSGGPLIRQIVTFG
jgi:hypothetical protein